MNIDYYTARVEKISIPVNDIICKNVYAVYRTPHYCTSDGYSHSLYEELFNVYTDEDVANKVVELIEK